MLHIIAGGSGTGKSTLLMQKIRQLLPQEPDCIILVPEQFSYEFDKKLYHFLGATAFNQLALPTNKFRSVHSSDMILASFDAPLSSSNCRKISKSTSSLANSRKR